jgi:RNA polymerase sigma-70 factor, ECF subfamily
MDLENRQRFEEEQLLYLYRTHYQDVYRFLLYYTGNANDVEDLTQEVFLRAYKAYARFEGRSELKTWILQIAKHVAMDHGRRGKMYRFLVDSLSRMFTMKTEPLEDDYERKENWEILNQAIQQLKPAYKAVVILRGIKELSVRETAEVLGCSETKVKVDYHRALKKLQQLTDESKEGSFANEYAK